uniref:C3H1-type domain-containing protein n=1 Tax=Chromera velia CCMP2878 TaxID=1169474 RepID=A0A0G4HJ65_9ALVE|eukprot:Cvel_28154.t1-p1 / transcript=Cvel_28154.t1 / gene=Cvel_28154 / organism=Chromera_velia_CCMP2878 / gene_product=hypothetical protein / transcript_product=hypothetical protein / location=Cvel_scaffold3635:8454-12198(-) / protein_length=566 / sequence_SO=supercontig / SO=protein_coding / is_pseudo=false
MSALVLIAAGRRCVRFLRTDSAGLGPDATLRMTPRIWMNKGSCPLGEMCRNAHGLGELKPRKYRYAEIERRSRREGLDLGTLVENRLFHLDKLQGKPSPVELCRFHPPVNLTPSRAAQQENTKKGPSSNAFTTAASCSTSSGSGAAWSDTSPKHRHGDGGAFSADSDGVDRQQQPLSLASTTAPTQQTEAAGGPCNRSPPRGSPTSAGAGRGPGGKGTTMPLSPFLSPRDADHGVVGKETADEVRPVPSRGPGHFAGPGGLRLFSGREEGEAACAGKGHDSVASSPVVDGSGEGWCGKCEQEGVDEGVKPSTGGAKVRGDFVASAASGPASSSSSAATSQPPPETSLTIDLQIQSDLQAINGKDPDALSIGLHHHVSLTAYLNSLDTAALRFLREEHRKALEKVKERERREQRRDTIRQAPSSGDKRRTAATMPTPIGGGSGRQESGGVSRGDNLVPSVVVSGAVEGQVQPPGPATPLTRSLLTNSQEVSRGGQSSHRETVCDRVPSPVSSVFADVSGMSGEGPASSASFATRGDGSEERFWEEDQEVLLGLIAQSWDQESDLGDD